MFPLALPWLAFSVNLDMVETHMKETYPTTYKGNQATGSSFELYFSAQPSDADVEAIQTYWSGLTETSTEVTSYVPQSQIASQIATLKAGLLAKTWDQMTTTERKLATNQPVTRADLGI